jgi:hypothetical protein
MVKPNKAICLAVESLVAFFAGCEQWLPKYYNVNKQVFSNLFILLAIWMVRIIKVFGTSKISFGSE